MLQNHDDVFSRRLAVGKGTIYVENSSDGHERVALTPKGYDAYRTLVQWINEVVRGRTPGP